LLGVAAPKIDADAFAVDTIAVIAFEARSALLTGHGRDHGDAIADFQFRSAASYFNDFAGGIGAEHMGQLNCHRILARANDAIERTIY
jgi:hypothetical protein